MKPTAADRAVLVVLGAVLAAIGAASLAVPAAFYSSFGIRVDGLPPLASELRATGGALLLLALAIAAGAVWTRWVFASAVLGALVAFGYAAGRGLSALLDGAAGDSMVIAGVVELILAAAAAVVAVRTRPRG